MRRLYIFITLVICISVCNVSFSHASEKEHPGFSIKAGLNNINIMPPEKEESFSNNTGTSSLDKAGQTFNPDAIWDPDVFEIILTDTIDLTVGELVSLMQYDLGMDREEAYIVIGTTVREGFRDDPFLYYSWACMMLNGFIDDRWLSAKDCYVKMEQWSPVGINYYSREMVLDGVKQLQAKGKDAEIIRKAIFMAILYRNEAISELGIRFSDTDRIFYESEAYKDIVVYRN